MFTPCVMGTEMSKMVYFFYFLLMKVKKKERSERSYLVVLENTMDY